MYKIKRSMSVEKWNRSENYECRLDRTSYAEAVPFQYYQVRNWGGEGAGGFYRAPPLLSCWKSKTIITYTAVNGPSGFKFFSSNDVNMQSSQFLEIYRSKIKRKFRLKQKFCKSYLKVKRHIVVKNRKSKVNCLTD